MSFAVQVFFSEDTHADDSLKVVFGRLSERLGTCPPRHGNFQNLNAWKEANGYHETEKRERSTRARKNPRNRRDNKSTAATKEAETQQK